MREILKIKKDYLINLKVFYAQDKRHEILQGDIAKIMRLAVELLVSKIDMTLLSIDFMEARKEKESSILTMINENLKVIGKAEEEITRILEKEDYWRD